MAGCCSRLFLLLESLYTKIAVCKMPFLPVDKLHTANEIISSLNFYQRFPTEFHPMVVGVCE